MFRYHISKQCRRNYSTECLTNSKKYRHHLISYFLNIPLTNPNNSDLDDFYVTKYCDSSNFLIFIGRKWIIDLKN